MADFASTVQLIRERGRRIHASAALQIESELDEPRDTGQLAGSKRVITSGAGSTFRTTITYGAPQADFTNDGTLPHRITGRPLLSFYWPKAGKRVTLRYVNHPGSQKHKGWFKDAVSQARWSSAIRSAVARTS